MKFGKDAYTLEAVIDFGVPAAVARTLVADGSAGDPGTRANGRRSEGAPNGTDDRVRVGTGRRSASSGAGTVIAMLYPRAAFISEEEVIAMAIDHMTREGLEALKAAKRGAPVFPDGEEIVRQIVPAARRRDPVPVPAAQSRISPNDSGVLTWG